MTIHLPEDLATVIRDAVESGQYVSLDDAIAHAVRLLRDRQSPSLQQPLTEEAMELKLVESGFLASVPPRDAANSVWRFEPVKIEGEPLSETVIRERR